MSMDVFGKILKWWFSTLFLVGGIYFLTLTQDTGAKGPFFVALLCFGMVYWAYNSRNKLPRPIILVTVGILGGTAGLLHYVPDIGAFITDNFFVNWLALIACLGTPIMIYAYKKTA